ncbi:glycoside hydrolase family 88 protein [Paenibacillus sp.]|uniref:glycoside hydrolase family 88/105 protein n=1 Tax=Paenibacillus sp. TaxID=58172 RepID=UPI002D4C0EFE|nr:glycoside hydrolase family 88 protein [Paenibacillus sp.]HZG84018.1 glycoside hydrolase family 88 protein [Paenibacillus sp.]
MPALQLDEQEIRDRIDRVVHRTFQMDFDWDWPGGVAFYGVSEAYEATGKEEYAARLKEWADEQLEDGLPRLTVNAVSIGHTLLTLYKATGDEVYKDYAVQMAEFLKHDAERFADGIFQHTVNSAAYNFPQQAWVDTMFMAGYFLVRIGHLLERDDYLEDGILQYHGHEKFLQCPRTNLYYHGWDHVSQTNMSAVFWGRGNAWAAITMARALRLIQVTHPSFMVIDGSLRDQLSALVRLQAEDGLWRTVLTDSDAYTETSASAGIAAALLSRGKLYNKVVNRSISGILSRIASDGSVHGVSAGTAVMRDAEGYKNVPCQRVQGWGQGLTLVFLSSLLAPQEI